jgi:hypothetical protein
MQLMKLSKVHTLCKKFKLIKIKLTTNFVMIIYYLPHVKLVTVLSNDVFIKFFISLDLIFLTIF